jgi:hypothetical protein
MGAILFAVGRRHCVNINHSTNHFVQIENQRPCNIM